MVENVTIQIKYVKNPITNWWFLKNEAGTSIGWGITKSDAKNHAISQVEKWNQTLIKDGFKLNIQIEGE